MSKSPTHLTVTVENSAVTVPPSGSNGVGRVLVYGDVLELTPGLLEQVGPEWVDQKIASGKFVAGSLDDHPEIRERRDAIDAAERARFEKYTRTGL